MLRSLLLRSPFRIPSPTRFLAVASVLLTACAGIENVPIDRVDSCVRAAAQPPGPRALAFAAQAEREHAAFGGSTLDAEGRLVESGAAEGEDFHPPGSDLVPWQRVLRYWLAVDPDGRMPQAVRYGALRPADRSLLDQAIAQASSANLQGLGVGPDEGLQSYQVRAAQTALARVAVIDTPWSAVFVSWLAKSAGFTPEEFKFSDAHADYAAAAWTTRNNEAAGEVAGKPTRYAQRACDLRTTPPRVGDLVCHARAGDADLNSFAALGAALASRNAFGGGLAMHCDVVVGVDATGFDAIGGNVLQSVTKRRFVFAPGTRVLDPGYRPDGCTQGSACVDRHLSRAPWAMLLQWR